MSIPIGMTGEGSQAILRLVDQLDRGPQILAIEEPETHLHPALIKKTGQLLTEAAEKGKQLFVCTHSPFLIDRASLDNLFVVRKGTNGTEVSPMRGTKDIRDTLYDIGMRPSDILFSDAILLVEGQSDEIFFNGLSQKLGVPLAECHVKVILASGMPRGRRKIEFWAEVGRDAGLPLYVILDKSADEKAQRAYIKEHLQPERSLVLERGNLEDYYPWDVLRQALLTILGEEVQEAIPVGQRVQEIKKLQGAKGMGNAWKPKLAEEIVRTLNREDAESEVTEVADFLRRLHADIGAY